MERITIIWTRPEGAEAEKVECTYATPQEASDTLADLSERLVQSRRTPQVQRQAVKDTLRGMDQ